MTYEEFVEDIKFSGPDDEKTKDAIRTMFARAASGISYPVFGYNQNVLNLVCHMLRKDKKVVIIWKRADFTQREMSVIEEFGRKIGTLFDSSKINFRWRSIAKWTSEDIKQALDFRCGTTSEIELVVFMYPASSDFDISEPRFSHIKKVMWCLEE